MDKKTKQKERYKAAMACIDAIGQFLILVDDCPKIVRDAWRTLERYIKDYEIEHRGQ